MTGSRNELAVAGPLPHAVADVIRSRFGEVTVCRAAGRTVLRGAVADQAALRALANLLWDAGSAVVALSLDGPDQP